VILVFGSINLDIVFPLATLPAPGQTLLGPAARLEPGGKGANQACAAARDEARVVMAGAVGQDALATAALALLEDAKVDLSAVARVSATTGCAGICVDAAGQNQIAVGAGANLLARAAQVPDALLGPDTILLLQMEVDPGETAALIARARAAGCKILLNLAPAAPLPDAALRALDFLLVNEDEAAWLASQLGTTADAASLQQALGLGVLRTLGPDGAEAATGEGVLREPGIPVKVVDTTAAGDCFIGVLAASLDRGSSLAEAMRRANRAAALCCSRPGSQASLPWRTKTDGWAGPAR
jgi:ribokinase